MNQKVSNKITYIYFAMSVLILNLHSVYMYQFNVNELGLSINQIVKIVCNMSVPTFFFVSALLFYRKENKVNSYFEIIKVKIRTLIVPYLCWNIICFPLKELKNYMSNGSLSVENPADVVINVFTSEYDPVLWFVRVLFVYFLLYPLFGAIIKRRKICLGLILAIIIINIYIGPVTGYSTVRYWLPIYLAGGYIGYWKKEIIFERHLKGKFTYSLGALLFLIGLIVFAFYSELGMYICRMLSPLCYWVIGDIFLIDRKPKWIYKQSFYFYCTQMIFSVVAQKIWINLCGNNAISAVFANFGIPIVLVGILMLTAYVFHKIMPQLYNVLIGGRAT